MIDYVVISSDVGVYEQFYPVVARMWKHFGYKTLFLKIDDHESDLIKNEFGLVKHIKSVEGIKTSLQAQLIRLYAPYILPDARLLTSDIDMMPLNIGYFITMEGMSNDKVVIFTGQPYGVNPYYPMCYYAGYAEQFRNIIGNYKSFDEMVAYVANKYHQEWNSDEHFFYDRCADGNEDKILVLRDRDLKRRIDRLDGCSYKPELLKEGHYIDFHMPRPYVDHKEIIDSIERGIVL